MPPQKTALVIGANGYIGSAVARAFARASYLSFGLVRSSGSRSGADPDGHGVRFIAGSPADASAAVTGVRSCAVTRLDVIVIATEDRSLAHFEATLDLISQLSALSSQAGVKPLVFATSGCMDYGPGQLDGAPSLKADTEDQPLNTPPSLVGRAQNALKFLQHPDLFDAAVTRPTMVHGYSSSFCGLFLHLGLVAKSKQQKLVLPGDARTILHSVHIDDCAEAYVALAEHAPRTEVAGQVFNMSSGNSYETLGQYARALETELELDQGVECVAQEVSRANVFCAWSQWISSEKISRLTGWKPSRPMFAEGIAQYRQEYIDAVESMDVTAVRLKPRFEATTLQ